VMELRASSRGNYLVLRTPSGLRVYDGRRANLPRVRRFGTPTAIAWSSDEEWVAVSTADRLVLRGARARIQLRLTAIDLAWTESLD
jgi:hypothetical protein